MRRGDRIVALTGAVGVLAAAGCSAPATRTATPQDRHTASSPAPSAAPWSVMPLGDSITDGYMVPGGYRTDLWRMLTEISGRTVHFVGSRSGGPAQLGEPDHEGHPGWEIGQLAGHVKDWLGAYHPSAILLQIGTNDLVKGDRPDTAPGRLAALVDDITTNAPDARLYVATLTPLVSRVMEAKVIRFNTAIIAMIKARHARNDRIQLVDIHAALTKADISADGTHPNALGYARMAARWYEALSSAPLLQWHAADPSIGTVNDGERLPSTGALSGTKIGYLENPDSYVELRVTVPNPGRYQLFVRAAGGINTTCSQLLTVNGRAGDEIDYPAYGWEQWTIVGAQVLLNGGLNTLRFSRRSGAVEMDSIALTPA